MEINPESANALENRGISAWDARKLQGRVIDLGKTLKINPESALALENRGGVHRVLKTTRTH